MSKYSHYEAPVVQPSAPYPPPAKAEEYKNNEGPYVAPPPPVGYPMKNGQTPPSNPAPLVSQNRGFWKGCCAGMCCCCLLDVCF